MANSKTKKRWRFRFGIRATFLTFVVFVLFALMLAILIQSANYQRKSLYQERRKLAMSYLKSLNTLASERIVTDNVTVELSMFDFMDQLVHDNPDIAEVYVQEKDGRILIHNVQKLTGTIRADSLTLAYLHQQKPGMHQGRGVLEFYAPVKLPQGDEILGVSRLVMRTDGIEKDIRQSSQALGKVFAVSFVLAIILTIIIVYRVTKPIGLLSARVLEFGRRFDPEDPRTAEFRIEFKGDNELGDLRDSFNRMTKSLQSTMEAKAQLHAQATTDGLTGLFNKRQFLEDFERFLARAKEENSTAVLMMLDMDHFKQLNDTVGHSAGDRALQDISASINARIRQRDRAYRVGGDEFVILLWGANLEVGAELGQRIAEHYAQIKDPTNLTGVSCGVVQYNGKESADDFYNRADTEMYRIKRERKSQRSFFINN